VRENRRLQDENGVGARRDLTQRQGDRPFAQGGQAGLDLPRVLLQGQQRRHEVEQLHELGEGREDLAVDRDLCAHPLRHITDGVEVPGREEAGPLRRQLPREAPTVGIAHSRHIVGLHVREPVGVDLGEAREMALAVFMEDVGVVVGRSYRQEAVHPVDDLFAVPLLDAPDLASPAGSAARQVHQDPVEAVAVREGDQGVPESLGGVPDVDGRETRLEEVVAKGELAHHRHPIGHSESHGCVQALATVHGGGTMVP
jgi:hypothetical protein